MTHEQQIKYDLAIYGQAFEMKDVTGKIVRIDPTMIRTIQLGNDNSISGITTQMLLCHWRLWPKPRTLRKKDIYAIHIDI